MRTVLFPLLLFTLENWSDGTRHYSDRSLSISQIAFLVSGSACVCVWVGDGKRDTWMRRLVCVMQMQICANCRTQPVDVSCAENYIWHDNRMEGAGCALRQDWSLIYAVWGVCLQRQQRTSTHSFAGEIMGCFKKSNEDSQDVRLLLSHRRTFDGTWRCGMCCWADVLQCCCCCKSR